MKQVAWALAWVFWASSLADVQAQSLRFFRVRAESNTAVSAFSSAGEVTWTNANPGGRFQVQWSGDLAGEGWFDYLSGSVTGIVQQVKLFDFDAPEEIGRASCRERV